MNNFIPSSQYIIYKIILSYLIEKLINSHSEKGFDRARRIDTNLFSPLSLPFFNIHNNV